MFVNGLKVYVYNMKYQSSYCGELLVNLKYKYVENKMPAMCNRLVFIAKRIVRSTCFGHHYAHHQELKNYTDSCCLWYMALWFAGLRGPRNPDT